MRKFFCLVPALVAALWLHTANAQGVVESVGITVSDLDRSIAFYREVLSFEFVAEREIAGGDFEHAFGVFGLRQRIARMRLGDESIDLIEFLAPRGRPIPVDSRSDDLWFQHIAIIVSDMDRAYSRLREHGVEHASSGPKTLRAWNPNAGGISAFYFRDPDGNHLEILEFPADKGQSKWHASSGRLFLGIDHTAIVVGDTDASLHFYHDVLGLEVVGHAENYGVEQERLNNVFGARLRITALRAGEGIGVELLQYVAPRTGRNWPADSRSNDLWHWQVNYLRDDLEPLDTEIRRNGYRYVSSGIVAIDFDQGQTRHVLMVRDPDGHASSFSDGRQF